jgi:hypothetical protein
VEAEAVLLNRSQPNNGMHPSANSVLLIVSLDGFEVECAAGDARR